MANIDTIAGFCMCFCLTAQFSLLIAAGSVAIQFYNEGFYMPNLDYLNQVVTDWETAPLTKIQMANDTYNCENGMEPVF